MIYKIAALAVCLSLIWIVHRPITEEMALRALKGVNQGLASIVMLGALGAMFSTLSIVLQALHLILD